MFFNQELSSIQEAKNRLAICCDLRRQLVQLEAHAISNNIINPISNLGLGLALIERVIAYWRQNQTKH